MQKHSMNLKKYLDQNKQNIIIPSEKCLEHSSQTLLCTYWSVQDLSH